MWNIWTTDVQTKANPILFYIEIDHGPEMEVKGTCLFAPSQPFWTLFGQDVHWGRGGFFLVDQKGWYRQGQAIHARLPRSWARIVFGASIDFY